MLQKLGKKIMIFDGAFGTELQKYNLELGKNPEEINIENPQIIKNIHKSYIDAGADFLSTNSFGINPYKFKDSKYCLNELVMAAINNAKEYAKKELIFFDMGPLGKLMAPVGTLTFEDAYNAFKEVIDIASPYVDGFILETFSDIYELKAAVLAVKENTAKPVFALMTFDETKRTLSGTTPRIMVEVLEGLNVDALGVNCSLGPKDLEPIIKEILDYTHTPVMIQPNRGLPTIIDGKTMYLLPIEEYDFYIKKFINMGVSIVGGCCGTNPEFIKRISKYKDSRVKELNNPYYTVATSSSNLVDIKDVVVCGERLNPTGKKKIKEALINEDYDYLILEAIKQEKTSDILDVNVGVPKIDEVKVMKNVITKLQEVIKAPLVIDSSNIFAIENAARIYNGIPIINSVNGDYEVMDKIFPVAKKYGCLVIGLTLDNSGVPKTAIERFLIAKRIVEHAKKYGINKNKIIIDTLTLTASAEQELVKETIKALNLVTSELNVKTTLGVSNVSFGLPNRLLLNKTFLTLAMHNGLNMPIINPCEEEMIEVILAYKALNNIDVNFVDYISKVNSNVDTKNNMSNSLDLPQLIKMGLKQEVSIKTKELLENLDAINVINDVLIPTLNEIGENYDKGKIFLPQLMMGAEAVKEAFKVISDKFPKSDNYKGTIIMATVKGDIHDIGKNIIKVILESYSYKVIDLGKDVSKETILEAYLKYKPNAIGLSALMTTTVLSMEETIKFLKQNKCISPIFVGGAVLTKDISKEINADYYSKDALEFVNILNSIIEVNDGKN